MKKFRLGKTLLAVGVMAVFALSLAACSNSGSKQVAATVNGQEIAEQTVTDQIQSIREQSQLSEEAAWGEFLAQNSMTPSSVRDQIIDSLVEQKLIVSGAKEMDIKVESSEVDEYVNSMKQNYDGDDAWKKALEQAGFTEASYRELIENSLYQQKLTEHFTENAQLSDEDTLNAAKQYAQYYDGAKRSSHILFKVDDKNNAEAMAAAQQQAQQVLDQINAGTLDFAEAAKQYSGDTGSAEKGGDVGWDVTNSFVTEYTDALTGLEAGQVSGLVTSEYGVHIIKVTEVFKAPEEITSLDQIPADFQDTMKEMAKQMKSNDEYTKWLEEQKNKADIKKNDMPSGLPYDLDMSKYQSSESSSAASNATSSEASSSATSTEGSTDGQASSQSSSAAQQNNAAGNSGNAAQ